MKEGKKRTRSNRHKSDNSIDNYDKKIRKECNDECIFVSKDERREKIKKFTASINFVTLTIAVLNFSPLPYIL